MSPSSQYRCVAFVQHLYKASWGFKGSWISTSSLKFCKSALYWKSPSKSCSHTLTTVNPCSSNVLPRLMSVCTSNDMYTRLEKDAFPSLDSDNGYDTPSSKRRNIRRRWAIRNDGSRVRRNESSSVCYIKSNWYMKRVDVYECKEHKRKLHTTKP